MRIDAHQHFWQLGRFDYVWMQGEALEPLRRDFLPDDLRPLLEKSGIQRSIFVQTVSNLDENRWVLELAARHEFMAGVVGWLDLTGATLEDEVAEFKSNPRFVGVRHQTHDEPDDDWILREDVSRGLAVLERHDLPFELLFYPKHLRHVPALAAKFPNLKMVINHIAKPAIRDRRHEGWAEDFVQAASFENVFCKLSGMITEADWKHWTAADLRFYVQTALDAFGPKRLMFGSDWPVCTLAGSYEQVVDALRDALGPISAGEEADIFGGTAERFYGLTCDDSRHG
ncbi:MAG: amidohydrolase family protein [Pirellulaceae bacterium]|nr:amidohydrolase family protein [Pirellulaceae bacterium]